MIDILVVSHACVTAINRIPWRRLAERGWQLEIATATQLVTKELVRPADPPAPDDPPLHLLPLGGPNLRFWRFEGLRELIARRRPKVVMLVERNLLEEIRAAGVPPLYRLNPDKAEDARRLIEAGA